MIELQVQIMANIQKAVKIEKAKARMYLVSIGEVTVGYRTTKAEAELLALYTRNELLAVTIQQMTAVQKAVYNAVVLEQKSTFQLMEMLRGLCSAASYDIETVLAAKKAARS